MNAQTTNNVQAANITNVILRLPTVKSRTGLSRSMLYLLMSRGAFPKSVSLGARAIGFVESEVDDWIAQKIEASRAKQREGRQ
jgi:prophage regulatory protein